MTVNISMPHRFCVRYDDGRRQLEFEVEPLTNGVLFYATDPKIISGEEAQATNASEQVLQWLRKKFSHVKVDLSSKPNF